ncbi:unnamed protein product [Mesocestoides corti]|uniref:Small monomeric GTPase n=1 Tax=Mesocestoides corti TaxID=53468 RepID=A0A0R3U318_MESCO|nr:unnamed protein product [Mesocestoides corti]
MSSPTYPEGSQWSQRPPSTGNRFRTNPQRYRQSTISSSSTSRPSPLLDAHVDSRHQARPTKSIEKCEQHACANNGPKKTRRHLPLTVTVSNDDKESVASTLDDFDYFCSISYSPNSKVTPKYTAETTQMKRQRMRGMRSHSMLHPNEGSFESGTDEYLVDRRSFSRTLTGYNQDVIEDLTPKRMSGNTSRHNSSVSLTQGGRTSHSPAKTPIIPQPPPHIHTGGGQSPLGAAISQEALDADDPDLVEFKVQIVGSPSVGKSTICQRLANLNGGNNDDFNEDNDDEFQALSVKATLNGKIFKVGFSETVIYSAEDSMNIEIQECVDAYVVVYAIDDESTFGFAKRVLLALRDSIQENSLPPAGFILVGNKFDLVRGREVMAEEGCQFAASQKAKFLEVSAVLDHKIPELLLTIITHLHELENAKGQRPKRPPTNELWGTSRKIAVNMAGFGSASGGGNCSGCDGSSRLNKETAKREIVKFFRKHFSKSFAEDSTGSRDAGGD